VPHPERRRWLHTRNRSAPWLADELQLTRVAELLAQQGVVTAYTTLRRFVRQAGLGGAPRDTVRMAASPPGEVAEFDFVPDGTAPRPSNRQARDRVGVVHRLARQPPQLRLAAGPTRRLPRSLKDWRPLGRSLAASRTG